VRPTLSAARHIEGTSLRLLQAAQHTSRSPSNGVCRAARTSVCQHGLLSIGVVATTLVHGSVRTMSCAFRNPTRVQVKEVLGSVDPRHVDATAAMLSSCDCECVYVDARVRVRVSLRVWLPVRLREATRQGRPQQGTCSAASAACLRLRRAPSPRPLHTWATFSRLCCCRRAGDPAVLLHREFSSGSAI
jgi:hypothetical protein